MMMNKEKIALISIAFAILTACCKIITNRNNSKEITSVSLNDYRYHDIYDRFHKILIDSLSVNIMPYFMKDPNCNCKNNYKADGHSIRNLWQDLFDSLPSELFYKLRHYKDSNILKNVNTSDSFLSKYCRHVAYRDKSLWQMILMSERYKKIDSILNSSYYFDKNNFNFNNSIKLNGIYICNLPMHEGDKSNFYNYLKFYNNGQIFISRTTLKKIKRHNIKGLQGLLFRYNCIGNEVVIESVTNRYSEVYARFDHYRINGDTLVFVKFEPSKDTTIKLRQTVIRPFYVFKSQK